MSYFDKYLVIWWNKNEEAVRVSKPMDYGKAINMALFMNEGKLFFREDEFNELDDGQSYKDWSVIVTKYIPVLKKDLWNELIVVNE